MTDLSPRQNYSLLKNLGSISVDIFKNLPFPYVIVDRKGYIVFYNDFFSKIVNERTGLAGKKISDFFVLDNEELNNIFRSLSNSLFTTYKIAQRNTDEKIFSVSIQKLNLREESYMQFFFQDISIEYKLFNQLQLNNRMMDDELSTAKKVLGHILYISPIYNSFIRFETFFRPSAKLGGDFFDIFQIDEDRVGVFIADVSGHGVSSSLITAALKMLITLTPKEFYSVEKMVFYLNSSLIKLLIEDQFVTLFYGVIDTKNHEIEYINCGHPMPLIFSEKEHKITHLEKVTFPLGISQNLNYSRSIAKHKLPDICKILFYTDGIFSFHKNNEIISMDDLKSLFRNLVLSKTTNILNNIYLRLLEKYERFEEDDISMLLVTINKNFAYKNYISIPSNVLEADNAIMKLIKSLEHIFYIDEDTKWKIYTCLYEALINAIVHGNKSNIQKRVFISYRVWKDWIVFKLKDEGEGFRFDKLPDPSRGDNILKTSGRGIFIIKKIMNKVKFNLTGNEITMFLRMD
ncbi:MAG: SpoIIE family protein phosphatase [Brevinematia bacterium]